MVKTTQMRVLAFVSLALAIPGAYAQLDNAISKSAARVEKGAQAQDKLDQIYDQTRDKVAEYKAVTKQAEGLKVYLQQLEKQLQNQSAELGELEKSVQDVTVIERQIVPLMLRMIDGLEQFVALDMPFLQDERRERVGSLRGLLERADVTVAEKFRNVMTAYTTEIEYGRTIEAYRTTLPGTDREVDVLRIGRIAMFYESLDGKEVGRWNADSQAFEQLSGAYRGQIGQGIRIAREQAAPDLVRLPIKTAGAAQ
jgi:DNA repair exonuclease SbcCD ATPase subunit